MLGSLSRVWSRRQAVVAWLATDCSAWLTRSAPWWRPLVRLSAVGVPAVLRPLRRDRPIALTMRGVIGGPIAGR